MKKKLWGYAFHYKYLTKKVLMEKADIRLDYEKYFYFTVIFDDDYKTFEYVCEKKNLDNIRFYELEYHMLKQSEDKNIRKSMKIAEDKEIIIYGHYNGAVYISNLEGIYRKKDNDFLLKKSLFISDIYLTNDLAIDSSINSLFLLQIGRTNNVRNILPKLLDNLPDNIEYIITNQTFYRYNFGNNLSLGLKKFIVVENIDDLKPIKLPWGCKLVVGKYLY